MCETEVNLETIMRDFFARHIHIVLFKLNKNGNYQMFHKDENFICLLLVEKLLKNL